MMGRIVRLLGLVPGLAMLWVAVAALVDWPPPVFRRGHVNVPMWVSPAQRFWVGSAMLLGGVYWCVAMLRRLGWWSGRPRSGRERLGDRRTAAPRPRARSFPRR